MRVAMLFFSFLIYCITVVHGVSVTGPRVLVVTDEADQKSKSSHFWSDLEGRGYNLDFASPKSDPSLFLHGARAYDNVLILPTKLKALGAALTPQILLDFVKAEGNILLALSAEKPAPANIVSLLLELDISIPSDRDAVVVDHFNYDTISASEKHDVIVLPHHSPRRSDLFDFFDGDGVLALPRPIGHVLGNASPLLAPIINAPSTAYSYSKKEEEKAVEDPFATGSQLTLVSAMQARNSARFTVLGSAEMLEDAWFDASVQTAGGKKRTTSNREFAKQLTSWAFKEIGVLKVDGIRHWLNEEKTASAAAQQNETSSSQSPTIYRIKNDVTFEIELSMHTLEGGWSPFVPSKDDALQLEFTMLSPYQRLQLNPIKTTSNSTIFTTSFRLPDQHGIFNFRVNYKRPFLTNVDVKDTVTVRHFAHDEWPRSFSISGAYPWILGIWATIGGWLLFVGVWLFSEPTDAARAQKKTQ